MKTRHKRTLEKYRKYGEFYNPSIDYEDRYLKFVNYGRLQTTRPTERKAKTKWHLKNLQNINNEAKISLCGASIINGLERFSDVWDIFFAPLSAINLGIGGDRTENLLWRMEDMDLPPTVEYLFIHYGTNNLCTSSCKDIADGILSTGVMAKAKSRNLKVIVGGLLHCDQDGLQLRSNVAEVNKTLKRKIGKLHQFYFMEEDSNWLENDEDSLNMGYYHEDHIHLNHKGNEKLANSIIRKLQDIESCSPSSSSGIILRIPSAEAPQKVDSGVSSVLSPNLSSVLSSSHHSPSSSHHVSSRPLFTEVPKSVYDHNKQLLALSSRPVCGLSSRHMRHSPQRYWSPRSPPLCYQSPQSSPSQPPPLPLLSSAGGGRSDNSGCDTSPPPSWSFLSLLMMLLSSISLPITSFPLSLKSQSYQMSSSQHPSSRSHSTQPRSCSHHSQSFRSQMSSLIHTYSSIHKLISVLFLFLFAFYAISILTHTSLTNNLTDCQSSLNISMNL